MFNQLEFNLSVDYFLTVSSVNVREAIEFFVNCYISNDKEDSCSYKVKYEKYSKHVNSLFIDAVINEKFYFEKLYDNDGRDYIIREKNIIVAYNLSLLKADTNKIINFADFLKIPLPSKIIEKIENNKKNEVELINNKQNSVDVKIKQINENDAFSCVDEDNYTDNFYAEIDDISLEVFISGLNIKNIKDSALISMDKNIHSPAVSLYGALYAGILMGKYSTALNKETLEQCLKKIGFKDCDVFTDKDFKAIWAAIPKTLKNKGAPRKAK